MQIAQKDRNAAAADAAQVAATRKPMPFAVDALLGRGKCEDCGMPWNCVATGYMWPSPRPPRIGFARGALFAR
jgi:hypothetical protein